MTILRLYFIGTHIGYYSRMYYSCTVIVASILYYIIMYNIEYIQIANRYTTILLYYRYMFI